MSITKIIKEEIDNSITQSIISDLFNAVKTSNEVKNLYRLNDNIPVDGVQYDYYITYEVTERPHIIEDDGDYYTPPSSDIYGDFDFEITKIGVFTKEGEGVCDDFLKFMTNDEYSRLKNMFDFDLYEIAYSNEDWDYLNEPDWDALKKENFNENKIKLTENDILYMVKRAINEVASKKRNYIYDGKKSV